MIVIELIYNLSVLVALSVLSGFLSTRFSKTALTGKIFQGLLFGITAIIGMLYPFNFAEGIIFDGRSIVISLCALFFGPLSGSIAAIMAAGYRLSIGGGGAIMGVLVILSSFLIGYFFYNYRNKKTGNKIQAWEFYVLGIIVHLFMLLFILTLPSKNIAQTYKTIALTIIGIYPLVTVLIGRILLDQEQNLDFINTLKESEKLFRTTLYSIGDGVITTDSDGKIVNMNNIASEITGWKETEVKDKYLSEVFKIINEDTMLPVENPVETILREGYIVGLANHTLLIRKDGKQVPISDSGSPIKNDDNKIIGVVLVFRDQTEERAQEKMMIESEERFRLLYENAPLSYQSLDINGNLIDVNQTWLQSLGYERDEVIGHHFSEFMTAQSGELIKSRFPFFVKIGEIHNFEFEMIRKDGTHMFVSYEGKIGHDKLGNFKQTHCIFSDITDRKSYEDSLRVNEEKYRMLLDFATDAFFQCDQSTCLITVNNKATELTGYTKEELLKMNLKELFPQKVLESNPLQFDLLRAGKTVKKERTIIRKTGNLVDVEMVSKQMPDGTIQSFFRDRTELKESEERFTSIVRGLSDMIIIVDGNGKIFYQSPSVTKILGYTETEMFGRSPLEFVVEEDKNNVAIEFKEVMTASNSGMPTVYNVYCKDGSKCSIETVGVNMLNNPAVNGVVLFSRDVTVRLKASLLEKENAKLFEDLIIKNTEPILILSFEGKILFANPACYKLAEIEESVNITELMFSVFMNEQESVKAFEDLKELERFGVPLSRDYEIKTLKNSIKWISAVSTKINFKGSDASLVSIRDITEYKKIESQIVASEKLYRDLVENINQGYYKANHRSIFTYCNPAISIVSGYSNEELLNMSAFRIVVEEDRKWVIEEYTKWATSGVSDSKIEFRIRTKEGIVKYVEQQTNIVRDKDRKIIGYSCVLSDITERKLIEKDLIDSEERFRKAFATSPDAIVISEAGTGKYIYVNPGFTALTGYSNEEVIGKTSGEINIFENYSERQSFLDDLNKNKTVQNFLTKFRIKSGEIRFGSLGAAILELNGAPHLISITRDITEQRLAEKALTDKQLQLQSVISNAPIILFVLDNKGVFVLSEGKGLSSLGLRPGEVVGHSAFEVYKDFPDIVESIKSTLDGKVRTVIHNMGKWVFDVNYTPLIDGEGIISGVIGVATDITERIKFEEVLKTSEENYKYLFENNPQPMWVYDIDTLEYLAVNDYAVNKYGYTKEEFLSMSLLDIRPEDERERLKKAVYNNDEVILKSGYWKHITKDGKILFVEIYSHRLDFMGRNARLVMANDVTERKIFEDALKKSEETYRLTAEQTGEVVYDHNMITKETKWAGAIEKVTGYAYDEFINTVADDIYKQVDPEDKDRVNSICKSAINNGSNYRVEYRFKHKNGNYIYVEDNAAFITDNNNKPVRMLGTLTDITKRKLIENKLRDLSRAVEQSPVSIVVTDIKGNIEYVNPKFEEVSGYSFDEVIGKNPKILSSGIKSTDDYQEMWKTILNGNEWHGEFFNKKKNGELYWEAATISPILNEKNEIEKFIAVKEDVTDQKKLTKELIEAKEKAEEMVRLKSYFFANMSHELRTPFVGILGFAEILKDVLENREEREYAEQILKSSKRLTDTLNKILNLSRIEFDKVEVKNKQVDVCELLRGVESFYSSSAKINNTTITSSVEEDNLTIYSDPKLLEDILNNLVSNAIKFTENGSITLSAKRIFDKDNARLLITVKDTGIGIPNEKQSLVWQEFRQASEGFNRSFEGTGLGLTITKRYVELLNGTIALISEEHKGTSFIISLPITKTNTDIQAEEKEIAHIKKSKEKIISNVKPKLLYVEDDAVALEFISIILRSAYDVDTAINAATALEYTARKEYDILMLDINLGRGMDGVELMQRIREIDYYKNIPMVAITAYAAELDKTEFLSKGFTHYISKPFTQKELHKLLAEVVNQK